MCLEKPKQDSFLLRGGYLGIGGPEIEGGIGTKTRIQSLYLCS